MVQTPVAAAYLADDLGEAEPPGVQVHAVHVGVEELPGQSPLTAAICRKKAGSISVKRRFITGNNR